MGNVKITLQLFCPVGYINKDEEIYTMKKIIAFFMAAVMMFTVVGCGTAGTKENPSPSKAAIDSSEDLLNQVWNAFSEDEKFAVMGGDYNHPVDGAAGAFDITDTESLAYILYVPADQAVMIDEAASLMHGMNANTFTGAAFHFSNSEHMAPFVEALKDNIMNTQWMCGFPDTLNIFMVNDEYVVSAFGNAEIMENFKTKLMEVFGDNAVLSVEENLI